MRPNEFTKMNSAWRRPACRLPGIVISSALPPQMARAGRLRTLTVPEIEVKLRQTVQKSQAHAA
jgi:hypothetical protein